VLVAGEKRSLGDGSMWNNIVTVRVLAVTYSPVFSSAKSNQNGTGFRSCHASMAPWGFCAKDLRFCSDDLPCRGSLALPFLPHVVGAFEKEKLPRRHSQP
jgi:hypothetical protein